MISQLTPKQPAIRPLPESGRADGLQTHPRLFLVRKTKRNSWSAGVNDGDNRSSWEGRVQYSFGVGSRFHNSCFSASRLLFFISLFLAHSCCPPLAFLRLFLLLKVSIVRTEHYRREISTGRGTKEEKGNNREVGAGRQRDTGNIGQETKWKRRRLEEHGKNAPRHTHNRRCFQLLHRYNVIAMHKALVFILMFFIIIR